MPAPLWLIDAFTSRPFRGNPAGVCWLDHPVPDTWMQSLANELNQAETAFVSSAADGFNLRWFTPEIEVDLCGHATLATGHFLWTSGRLDPRQPARFHTRSGVLTARREHDDRIVLDFPSLDVVPVAPPEGFFAALNLPGGLVYSNRAAQPDYLVMLDREVDVHIVMPNFAALKNINARGVIVTAPGDRKETDFVSRFFAPAVGIDEDPVTGSAHCTLAPFWAPRLGKSTMVGYQASRRGGVVETRIVDDRVHLAGHAVTMVRGEVDAPGTGNPTGAANSYSHGA